MTMNQTIKKVVILGGGTAGWMTAALLKKVLGEIVVIELVESEEIGRIGVGEATIPPIRHFNEVLGINEFEFIRETKASIKLAIKFENWRVNGESYFHTFGAAGKAMAFCPFHHYWLRAKKLGDRSSLWDYDLNYLCAKENKFSIIQAKDPIFDMLYAYHFDAGLYAAFLRKYSEGLGVLRAEGKVKQVEINNNSGDIEALVLESDNKITGDLFIDCSGLRGLLIQEKLNTGYDDWSHWLPCDRAVAIPSERLPETLPYTRSIAHSAGWQWRIPLQHRNGNGLVYSSQYLSDDEAKNLLEKNLETRAIGEPNLIRFKTGRRLKQWNRNVIAIGLSSGFLEPLESTSIHLIQSAIVRLIKFFPHYGISEANRNEYNRLSKIEFEQIRDFIILHYHVNEREDSQFWRDLRGMEVPETLSIKIKLFSENGKIYHEQDNLFSDSSWLQVMLGQGIYPKDYHPIANNISEEKLKEMLTNIKTIKTSPLAQLTSHDEFINTICLG
jgi:tryptophan 7-halogenase